MPHDSYTEIFSEIERILVVFAHPDDAEIVCGGLISRLAKDGKQVRILVTTNGGKGMQSKEGVSESDFGAARSKEQTAGAEVMGVSVENCFNLGLLDGEVENNVENIGRIVFHIRQFKPDLIITHNPQDYIINFNNLSHWVNHRDHRHTASIVFDAAYPYSRDRGFYPEQFTKDGLAPHSITKLLIGDSYTSTEIKYFDITDFTDQKAKAIQAHASAIEPEAALEFVEENKQGDRYFEPLRYVEIY